MDQFVGRLTIPATSSQSQCIAQNYLSLYNGPFLEARSSQGKLDNGFSNFEETLLLPQWFSSHNCSSETGSNFEPFVTVVSRLHQHLLDANVEISYTEYLDLMKLEVDLQLNKLKENMRVLKGYNVVHDGDANGSCSCPVIYLDGKLVQINEDFNGLKLLLVVVFRKIREMLDLVSTSIHDLKWEHELQLEVTGIMIGDCIRGLQDELERKFCEQNSIVNNLRNNWQETVVQCGAIRDELIAISNMLLPSEEESHISHSRQSATQKSVSPREVISEKSDFRHLKGMNKEQMINYFRSEISKLKRLHELSLQEKTEELFKYKREKGSLALKHDVEFEPIRKKVPEIISRVDQIIPKTVKAPAVYSSSGPLDERSRLHSRIDSLYCENQHLRALLAQKTKDVKELSCQISNASKKVPLQLSLEEQLLRQVSNIKGDYEDLYAESTIRDEVYRTVTRKLVEDYRNSLEDATLNFQEKLSSLQATISEKEKALCLANEENLKLKEKLVILEQEHFMQNNQGNPGLVKQENEEMILRDIEMEAYVSPRRSYRISEQNIQFEELIKLSQNLEMASTVLKEVETKKLDYNSILDKNEQENQLDCILVSITDLSKEFVDIEHKMSGDTKESEKRSEILSDRYDHMVQQTIALTKKGLLYKQMLDTRRSELQKAEAEVDILGNKVNALLSLVQKIYVTLEQYSPVFQQYPGLLDAFLKTCKLVAGLRSKQKQDQQDTT